MKFQLPTIALLIAASQFSIAEMPKSIETANSGIQTYAAAQAPAQITGESLNTDAGTLPGAVIKVARGLELKLEQVLEASFDLGFIGESEIASAH